MSTVGERLREQRKALGFSQEEFAARAGVSRRPYLDWEANRTAPTAVQLAALAYAGADVRYIVTGERDYAPPEPLKAEERVLLDLYRQAAGSDKAAALRVLAGGGTRDAIGVAGGIKQRAGRDIITNSKVKKKP